jgi:hypothetical protein
MLRSLSIAAALVLTFSAPVRAGIVDSPIPAPFTQHIFSVSGVINNVNLAAYISCTNADTQAVTVGVEVFGPAGGASLNVAASTAISVAAGATVLFGTTTSSWATVDANLATGPVSKGSARILATSKKLVCSAFLVDPSGQPPVSIANLTIVAKVKQKGD